MRAYTVIYWCSELGLGRYRAEVVQAASQETAADVFERLMVDRGRYVSDHSWRIETVMWGSYKITKTR